VVVPTPTTPPVTEIVDPPPPPDPTPTPTVPDETGGGTGGEETGGGETGGGDGSTDPAVIPFEVFDLQVG